MSVLIKETFCLESSLVDKLCRPRQDTQWVLSGEGSSSMASSLSPFVCFLFLLSSYHLPIADPLSLRKEANSSPLHISMNKFAVLTEVVKALPDIKRDWQRVQQAKEASSTTPVAYTASLFG